MARKTTTTGVKSVKKSAVKSAGRAKAKTFERVATSGTQASGAGNGRRGPSKVASVPADVTFDIPPLPIGNDSPAASGTGSGKGHMVIYVHGIGPKPREEVLKCQWDTALFGNRMGDRTRLAYWVNRAYYPRPLDATCAEPDEVRVDDDEISTRTIMALSLGQSGPDADEQAVENEIEALAGGDPNKRDTLKSISKKMLAASAVADAESRSVGGAADSLTQPMGSFGIKIVPFRPLRQFIARRVTRAFMRDVHDFLYVPDRRQAMLRSVAERITAGGGPFVVIGHSQGSMIAYQFLRQLDAKRHKVPLFITIGSPLGIKEVQDALRDWGGGKLEVPDCVERWLNVADPRDIVALPDTLLKNDFGGDTRLEDLRVENLVPDDPHSSTGYLRLEAVRQEVRKTVGSSFAQPIAPFVIAGDFVEQLEGSDPDARHATLIQLAADRSDRDGVVRDLNEVADAITGAIDDLLRSRDLDPDEAHTDRMRRYLSADLTRLEVEVLRSRFRELKIEGIWRNAPKQALISRSTHTVQARPGNLGYGADGQRIAWAVLDTGICANHPHFQRHANVVVQYDCTGPKGLYRIEPGEPRFNKLDKQGHGTHVAAIIAGECRVAASESDQPDFGQDPGRGVLYAGMAPACKLYSFKVLDDNGNGRDSWIIKALDEVAAINERAGQLVIHGVNLSLGGNFDPSVFGCGHTPMCQELRRLWGQGVLVCLAAGNEGYTWLRGETGYVPANLDLSIGDPANLEEAIAVGSVHKSNPHTYGVSYFSSRGPTADGRRKPDLVAPGERIVSARHDWTGGDISSEILPKLEDLYVERSGTSMAAPHVSGLLAAYLSLHREFIGYPARVKQILLDNCIDLNRDCYAQGAGMPSLIKMLALH